jgi:16S rRNA (guanine1516-N2)-methyltransferase
MSHGPFTCPVAVLAAHPAALDTARRLAAELGLPLLVGDPEPPAGSPAGVLGPALLLAATEAGLELRLAGSPRRRPLRVDWSGPLADEIGRPGAARDIPLARALGRAPAGGTVVDATAGLGRDAFRLACLGFSVLAVERSPILAALLTDGLARAMADQELAPRIVRRLTLRSADARTVLAEPPAPDIVLIDPMYPAVGRSALPRGEMQLLRRLLGTDEDAAGLLAAARRVARDRVVVKRHARDPALSADAPTRRVIGRSTRFDVYLAEPPAGA